MAGPRLTATVPILRSFDEQLAKDFYLRYLGFSLLFEHRFAPAMPLYFAVRRGTCELHLSEHHGDATPGSAVRIETGGLVALHAEVSERGHPGTMPGLEVQPWGFREMAVIDPFGNRLVFCESL